MKELDLQFENAIDQDEWKQAEFIIEKMAKLLGKDHADVRAAREELLLNRWEED